MSLSKQDEEASATSRKIPVRLAQGYPTLAKHLGSNPELAIFRRFEGLNTQNLLYLQARLVGLEKKLREAELKAEAEGQPKSWRNRDWDWLQLSGEQALLEKEEAIARTTVSDDDEIIGEPNNDDYQLRLFLAIRRTLKEYNDTALQLAQMAQLPSPGRYDLKQLRRWMSLDTDGRYPLVGLDRDIWTNSNRDDLFALRTRPESDAVSVFITDYFMPLFHTLFGRCLKPRAEGQITTSVHYNDRHILRFASAVATLLSAVAMVTPIAVLYKITSMPVRIGVMAAFTAVFSVALSVLTNTKRGEIFAAI